MAQMLKQSPFCSSIGTNTHCLTYSAGFLLKVTFAHVNVIFLSLIMEGVPEGEGGFRSLFNVFLIFFQFFIDFFIIFE